MTGLGPDNEICASNNDPSLRTTTWRAGFPSALSRSRTDSSPADDNAGGSLNPGGGRYKT